MMRHAKGGRLGILVPRVPFGVNQTAMVPSFAVQRMISLDRTLENQLNVLEQVALLRRAEPSLELEYLFKHGLVQETAYDSLLRNDRKRLHRFVAETLEKDDPGRDERATTLARHWDNAGEPKRAFDYYLRAGQEAARVFANQEAR